MSVFPFLDNLKYYDFNPFSFSNAIYIPKKHTVCSYATQKRNAKKRKNIKKHR